MFTAVTNFFSSVGFSLLSFLFVVTIVVFFHEMGHFLVGRFYGVKVDMFSIGFGREGFGWNDRYGTRWKVSWLPFGGYVRFAGDADASSKPADVKHLPAKDKKAMLQFKPLSQRTLVIAAGPIMNFILAIVLFAVIFMIE